MIFWLACVWSPEKTEEERLAEASQDVIFASVEQLGVHRYQAQVRRKEFRGDLKISEHEEQVQIEWVDWDNFSYVREVDSKEVMNLVVVDHTAWQLRKNGSWAKRPDAEPYRVQMRSSWNTWEQVVAPFSEALLWRELGASTLEGREVQRYELSLDTQNIPQRRNLIPKSISGSVAIDQATAVRIYAEVQLVSEHDDYRKEVSIQLKRQDIGEEIRVKEPVTP